MQLSCISCTCALQGLVPFGPSGRDPIWYRKDTPWICQLTYNLGKVSRTMCLFKKPPHHSPILKQKKTIVKKLQTIVTPIILSEQLSNLILYLVNFCSGTLANTCNRPSQFPTPEFLITAFQQFNVKVR